MRLAFSIFITFCILAIQPSVADQGRKETTEQIEAASMRQKHERLSSAQLGDLLAKTQEQIYSISQRSASVWDISRDTRQLQKEQDAILELLHSRSKEGDREAGFQFVNWQAFLCTGFLKQQARHFADPICNFASQRLEELADRGELRAMEILGKWYESGTYFKQSNYVAAEWYAKIMLEAAKYGHKSLAISFLEKVDRLYPKYPDLENYRRRIHALK